MLGRIGVLAAFLLVAFGTAQAPQPSADIEFRVGSLLESGVHRALLIFTQNAADPNSGFVVAGVVGPAGLPVPSGGSFPLDLNGFSEYRIALHQAPQVGEYRASVVGEGEFELTALVPELTPLAPPDPSVEVSGSTLVVEWEPVPDAVSYLVVVSSPGSMGTRRPLSVAGPETHARFEGVMPDTYELMVQAFDHAVLPTGEDALPANPRISTWTTDIHVRRE